MQTGTLSPFDLFAPPSPEQQDHGLDLGPHADASAHPEDSNPLFAAMAQELQIPIPPQQPMPAPAPRPHHGAGNGVANGIAKLAGRKAVPDFSGLPPQMAASLAKLAGVPWPPEGQDEQELADHAAGPAPGVPHREG
jgi:hypothetical protein